MAVLGRLLLASGERLDLADILSIDSYTAGDFKYLLQGLIGNSNPLILKGFEVINPGAALGTQNISISIADAVVLYPTSDAGPFYVGLPQGNINAQPLIPELVQNATNYVYLTLTTFDTSQDSRSFWDPDLNGGSGGEFTQDVNTESALAVQVGVSTASFPTNTIPICKVVMGTTITSIQDAREMMFRLGTGGLSPNPFNRFSWPSLPTSSYQRTEAPGTITSGAQPNPFEGADKNISNLKAWMDAVMSKLAELGGTTYWYDDVSTFNLVNLFMDTEGSVISSTGIWTHSATIPGHLSWSAPIFINVLFDPRTYEIDGPGSVQLADGQVAYISLNRHQPVNGSDLPLSFVNDASYVNGAVGYFANLNIGDWVGNIVDPTQNMAQVVQFFDSLNGTGSVTSPALAVSISIASPYLGPTASNLAVFDQGVYTTSDVVVSYTNTAALTAAGGNFFWLAYRDDNVESINGAYAFFSGTIPGTSTAVLITANNPGVAGNAISLVFNGSNTITAAIATWNAAHPTNLVTLTSGNGTQVPSAGTTLVSGGIDGSIVATTLAINITTNDGSRALVTSNPPNNLAAGQRITISGTTHYNGVQQVIQIVSPTQFYISQTAVQAVPESGSASYATVTTTTANGFPTDATINISGTNNYGGNPLTSGTLTKTSGTGDATISFSSWHDGGSQYTFTVVSANATIGATYTNNGQTFTVMDTITAGTTLVTANLGNPYQIAVIDATHFNIPIPAGSIVPPPSGSPPLGTAATYGLLAASTITNSGSSIDNGDLGLYPGTSVTGFPPGVVAGVTNVNNAAAIQAQTDALAAYTFGNAQTATPISSTLDGQTLTPGVYSESSGTFHLASSGTGTLTLNGAGVYIFKCASTLTTGAGGIPIINLTNGALAKDVYWIVGSSATINSGSPGTFQGTIIADASITNTSGGVVNGRLIALTGAVTLSAAATINVPASVVNTPTEISGTITLAAIIVRTQQGAFTLYQDQSIPINGTFNQIVAPPFISGTPDYALPPGYNTLFGTANYNSLPSDSVVTRLSELTGMMADKAQDKTVKYLPTGLQAITNVPGASSARTDLTGQNLGTVGTLSPGVYFFTSSAALTGTLTLDAGGDPNAQWVFQIGSTLTTASNAVVAVINGGQAGNIFWQVGSSATIGTNTIFKGNIYAQASVTVTTGASINGRVRALTGAVTLNNNAIAIAPVSPGVIATTMGTAINYGVIANSTITNTGGTVITGSLALSPGTSVTGFPPGTVSGTQDIANGAAAQALTDATATYTYLAALTGSVSEFQDITFTPGSTLTILQPGSPGNAVVTLPSSGTGIQLGINQSAYVTIDRNNPSTPSIVVAATSLVPVAENVFVIAARLTSTTVYMWDGFQVVSGGAVPVPVYDAIVESQDRNMKLVAGGDWSWSSGGSSPINFASYANAGAGEGDSTSNTTWTGEVFTAASSGSISSVTLYMNGISASGNLTAQIYAASGGVPTGPSLGTSNVVNASGVYSGGLLPFPAQVFTFGTPVTGIISGQQYALVINSSGLSGTILYEHASAVVSGQNEIKSSNSGVSWTNTSPFNMVFSVDGVISTGATLAWSANAYLQIPSLAETANTILAGNVVLPTDQNVAYVEVNRSGAGGNLSITVADIAAVPLDYNTVIIARRVGANVIVGNNSMLLIPGESKALFSGVSDQNLALIGSGVTEATSNPGYAARGSVNRIELDTEGALDAIARHDKEFDKYFGMFRMIAKTAGTQTRVRITGSDRVVFTGETLTQSMSSLRVSFTGAEIDFHTGQIFGGDATLPLSTDFSTALGVNFSPTTISANQYLWYSIAAIPSSTNADNTINVQFNVVAGASSGSTTILAAKPPLAGVTPLGYVAVQDNGTGGSGTILNLAQVNIAQLGVGAGSGSGSGLQQVRLFDPVSTTLSTGNPVTIDGVSVNAGDLVLFNNLASGNHEIYKAIGVGTNITSWQAQFLFNGSVTPSGGNTVVITAGTSFADTIGVYSGTTWNFNNKVRYFNGADYWEVSSLNSAALANNQVAQATWASFAWLGSENMIVDYSILRGTAKETGTIIITTDGTNVGLATANVNTNAVNAGITFFGVISGSNINLNYTSTNTGSAGQIKFVLRRWSDGAGGPGGIPSYSGGGGGAVTGAGSSGQLAIFTTGTNIVGNVNLNYDTTNNLLELGSGANIVQTSTLQSVAIPSGIETNQSLFSYSDTFTFAVIEYSVVEGSNFRIGTLLITQDGVSTVNVVDTFSEVGTGTGLTFASPAVTHTITGGLVNIKFNATSSNIGGTFKYSMRRWS